MKVQITDRSGADVVTEGLREHIAERLGRIGERLHVADEAEVEFDRERRRSHQPLEVVTISVRMFAHRAPTVIVRQTGLDLRRVAEIALDRVDSELHEVKELLRS